MLLTDVTMLKPGSHKLVEATCDFGLSPKCRSPIRNAYRDMLSYMESNGGKNICLFCSKALKFVGIGNPNCRYKLLDRSFLDVIDCEGKAYLLGWIGSDGSIREGEVTIKIKACDAYMLATLSSIVSENTVPVKPQPRNMVGLTLSSSQLSEAACRHLEIAPGKKDAVVHLPMLSNIDLTWHFLRGYFDGDGSIRAFGGAIKRKRYKSSLAVSIASQSPYMREAIEVFLGQQGIKSWNYERGSIEMWSAHAYRFMVELYKNSSPSLLLRRKKERFDEWDTRFDWT